jgi:hypothetical protein
VANGETPQFNSSAGMGRWVEREGMIGEHRVYDTICSQIKVARVLGGSSSFPSIAWQIQPVRVEGDVSP